MIKWAFNFRAWQPTRSEWMFCGQCIQNEEKDRIQRFVFKKDAKAAMVGRLLIRKLIADCLKIPYKEIRLGRTEKGKPFLENLGHENFSFNVSHHGDLAVLAASTGLVGIDVMKYEIKSYVKALGTGIGFDISRVNFDFKTDFLQENTVTVDTSMKVDGVHYPEWVFEEHSLNNHCIVEAQNQKNTPDSHNQPDATSKSFEHLSLNDLVECASPLSDPDEEFWGNFEPKDEAPQIRQKNAA